jgi:UDP-galactopyranose mutase
MKLAIIGSGFTGSILAHEFAKNNLTIDIFESRSHIGGNCFTERDAETEVLIHKYGPHIFHTDNEFVWSYVNNFSNFVPFINRVKAVSSGQVFSLPINLHTINQFFDKTFNPNEARLFIENISDKNFSLI